MTENNTKTERDRKATEQRIIDTIEEMIAENGFENIRINAVSAQSGVSKILIYRYFGSVEGLITAYIKKHDFWLNFSLDVPDRNQLPTYLKSLFKLQIEHLHNNPTLKRLYRWELSSNNDMIIKLREQRERNGLTAIHKICELTNLPQKEIEVMATVITASITYLIMLEEFCPVYNGIEINNESGWQQIIDGINALIDKVL